MSDKTLPASALRALVQSASFSFRCLATVVVLGPLWLAACSGGAGTPVQGAGGLLEFHGEQQPFGSFNQDTGYFPDGSPVQVRFEIGASGGIAVDAQAVASGELTLPTINGKAGSGKVALDASITLAVSLKVDVGPIQYDGPLMGAPDIRVVFGGSETFDPFLLGSKASVAAVVPDTEIAAVPLQAIAGIPGTLRIRASGTVSTDFSGTCAAVSGGSVQYLGETATSGMLVLGASVDIDIPLRGTMSFGPFSLPAIPIGPFDAPLNLGTRQVATTGAAVPGEAATVGSCGAAPGVDGGPGADLAVGPDVATSDAPGAIDGAPLRDMPINADRPPADPSLVGQVCSACPGNPCFGVNDEGLCTFECTQDETVCGPDNGCVETAEGTRFCLAGCFPVLGQNECGGPGTACSIGGVCVPACASDADCEGGASPSYCNLDLGDCLPVGSPTGRVGDPCTADGDSCPRNGICLDVYPGGICSTYGCDLGGAFSCPQGFDCVPAAQGSTPNSAISVCLPTCTPDAFDGICPTDQTCTDAGDGHFVCVPPQ